MRIQKLRCLQQQQQKIIRLKIWQFCPIYIFLGLPTIQYPKHTHKLKDLRPLYSPGELAQLDAKIDSLLGSTDSGQLQCLMCGKTSNVRWNIRNHIETHVAKSGFNCDLCGKQYRTRNSLNVHKSKHHKTGQEQITFEH